MKAAIREGHVQCSHSNPCKLTYSYLSRYTPRNIFEILLNQSEIRLHLPFSDLCIPIIVTRPVKLQNCGSVLTRDMQTHAPSSEVAI